MQVPYEHLDGDPAEWAAHAMAELRHYQRAFLPTQRLVILFHRQHFTATAHASHWRALLAALKAQDKDGENDPAAMSALATCASAAGCL